MLQETEYSNLKLYAKIGCMDRETQSSTKLQIHVYTDNICSQPYEDGESSKFHATNKGYEINGYYFSTRVSFRPPFYSCHSCAPEKISETFNKKNGNWYDDDYISQHGKKQGDQDNNNNAAGDDGANKQDDYFNDDDADDAYYYSNDDVAADDDARYHANNNNDDANNNNNDDDNDNYYYNGNNNYNYGNRDLKQLEAAPGQLEVRSTRL